MKRLTTWERNDILVDFKYVTPTVQESIRFIRNTALEKDIYNQLAEEASELAQAALKMVRVDNPTNPTDKTLEQAKANLIEEYTDLVGIAELILGLKPHSILIGYKMMRWANRLKESTEKAKAGD